MELDVLLNLYLRSLKSAKKSIHTQDAYKRNIKEFIKRNNISLVEEFQDHTLSFFFDYIDQLNEEFEPSTVNQHIATIKTFYKFLLKQDLIDKNPTKAIEEVVIGEKIYQVLDNEEIEKLLNITDRLYLKNPLLSIRNKLIIKIFIENGVRVFELENMKLSNVNYKQRRILILGKWNIERYVYFSEETFDLLLDYLQEREYYRPRGEDVDYIFITEKGTRVKKRAIQQMIDKYIDVAKITPVSTHGLRHTCASAMFDKGYSMKDIQTRLGHKRISTTEKYIHTLNSQRAMA